MVKKATRERWSLFPSPANPILPNDSDVFWKVLTSCGCFKEFKAYVSQALTIILFILLAQQTTSTAMWDETKKQQNKDKAYT